MINIKSLYTDYSEIVKKFTEERICNRFEYFIRAIESFINTFEPEEQKKLCLNDKVLQYCIMDYFSDIYRLKEFHEIEKINDIKRVAYESQWILRRKPIQILDDSDGSDNILYANEKFVLTYLVHELLGERENNILTEKSIEVYKSFSDSLYYHLKYRNCDAKVLELMILAFKAGLNYNLKPDDTI